MCRQEKGVIKTVLLFCACRQLNMKKIIKTMDYKEEERKGREDKVRRSRFPGGKDKTVMKTMLPFCACRQQSRKKIIQTREYKTGEKKGRKGTGRGSTAGWAREECM